MARQLQRSLGIRPALQRMCNMSDRHFAALLPGAAHYEDVYAPNLKEAREKLRRRYDLKRLPRFTQLWVLSEPKDPRRNDLSRESPYSAASGM